MDAMAILVKGVEEATRNVKVYVSPYDFLNGLKREVCKVPEDAYLKDGKIVTAYDTSYHGSPSYEYTTYDVPELETEIFCKIQELEKLLKERDNKH